mmetsp:Transcript_960/g.1108  ORF Transcript_960/g.1108 Transcript_960/m.1108 type:complete len:278 (+) Transcript_960:45-878(+)
MTKEESKISLQPTGKIRIICAGLGRTGTLSLTDALKTLGYNPYHYIDFTPKHADKWTDLAASKGSVKDVMDVVAGDGYDAILDNPACDVYSDILKCYPDAKVILTVRDSKEKFETSWKRLLDTMVVTEEPFKWSFPSFFQWISTFQQLKKIRHFMGTTHLKLEPGELTHGWREKTDGWLGEQYERHNKHVIENVPSEQLLIFNVKEGWEPLCKFLQCDVPSDQKFPHSKVNDSASLQRMKKMFLVAIYGWIPAVALTTAGVFFAGRHVSRSIRSSEL